MNITLLLYIVELADHIQFASGVLIGVSFLTSVALTFLFMMNIDDEENHESIWCVIKFLYKRIWILIVAIMINFLLPSKNTMYLMVASKYISDSSVPSKLNEILNLKLEDILKQIKKEKEHD